MENIKSSIKNKISCILGVEDDGLFMFETPADRSMGDVALPCFKFSRLLHKAPQLIASELAEKLDGIEGVSRINPVGGYLNFFVDRALYSHLLAKAYAEKSFGRSDEGNGKTVLLDFSSPNIAKRFHLGHLGTTAIGNSLRNIYDFLGEFLCYLKDCCRY